MSRCWACTAWLLLLPAAASAAEPPAPAPAPAAANDQLPLEKVKGQYRQRVLDIIAHPQFHRRGPVEVFPCQPELFSWLLEHPGWVAEFWRHLGVPVGEINALPDGYECRDSNVSQVQFHTVYDGPDVRIAYCVGESKHSLIPGKLRAEMVLVHRYRFAKQSNGRYFLVQQLEGYVAAESATIKAVMKLTSATSERVIDRMLQDLMMYFSVMCRVMQLRPTWTLETIGRIHQPGTTANDGAQLQAIIKRLPPPVGAPVLPPEYAETPLSGPLILPTDEPR